VGLLILAALRGGGALDSGAVVQELSLAGAGSRSAVDRADPTQPEPVNSSTIKPGSSKAGSSTGSSKTGSPKTGSSKTVSPPLISPTADSPLKFAPAQPSSRSGQAILSFNPPKASSPPRSPTPVPSPSSLGAVPATPVPAAPAVSRSPSNPSGNSPQVEAARKLLRTNQASHFNQAIAQLRQLPPGQPGYDSARQDMNRWSRTIYDLAAGRAEQGDYAGAIAAAKLVPADLDGSAAAQASLAQWQQQAPVQSLNSRALAKAQSLIQPHQASTYSNAIAIARTISPGQPQAFEAQRFSSQWSTEIWNIAQARAKGREWSRAIAAAKLVPADSPHYAQAQAALKTWTAP
jgi:hypothetical protein